MSPSPGDSGWLPVQNVMPPSEAISTGRPYSRTLRAVHGAITSRAPTRNQHSVAQAAPGSSHSPSSRRKNRCAGRVSAASPPTTPHHSSHTDRARLTPLAEDTCCHAARARGPAPCRASRRRRTRASTPAADRPRRSRPPTRPARGPATRVATAAIEPDAKRPEHRLRDLDGRERLDGGGRRDRGQEKRVERRAPEPFRLRLPGNGGGIAEAAALRQIGGKRQILPLVVGQRLADPVAEPERQPEHQASQHREPYRSSGAGDHCRLSNRSAEICSETRPTRKITTASMMSSTDELVMCDCVQMVQTA